MRDVSTTYMRYLGIKLPNQKKINDLQMIK